MGDHSDDAINDAVEYEFLAEQFLDGDMDYDEAFDHDFIGPGADNNPVLAKLEDERMPMSHRTINRELYIAVHEFDKACRAEPPRAIRSVSPSKTFSTPYGVRVSDNPKCGRCGDEMRMREGRFGMFYFCANQCKGQKTISASDWDNVDDDKKFKKPFCTYSRDSDIYTYTPSCTGDDNDVHEQDIAGDFCQFCGKKIRLVTGGIRDR